jgi:glutathione peroxidase
MTATLQDIPFATASGEETSLKAYDGQVMLIVNVASKCGLTTQYEALETIHESYADKGFSVIGFPANDFNGQEPGSNEEIQSFCRSTYGVKFPVQAKISVVGDDRHPLYDALIAAQPTTRTKPGESFRDKLKGFGITPTAEPEVLWNFEKFLVNRHSQVVDRFAPDLPPDDPLIVEAIERALAAD